MIPVSSDNAFIGATVSDGKDNFTIIKVNAKSMYVAKGISIEQYNKMWEARKKGETFKSFCEKNQFEMVKYGLPYQIDETEIAKKDTVEVVKREAPTSLFGESEKAVLEALLKAKKIHRFANISVGNSTIMRVMDQKDNIFLLNVDNNYILYNKDTDTSYVVCSVYDYGEKVTEIPWDKVKVKEVA